MAQQSNDLTSAGSYYLSVQSLTPRAETQGVEPQVPSEVAIYPKFAAYAVYGPYILFFSLFIAAFGLLILHRTRTLKSIFTAAIVALFAASIPTLLGVIDSRNALTLTQASPDTIPRSVEVVRQTAETALVTWKTGKPQKGAISIGVQPYNPQRAQLIVADAGEDVREHTAIVGDLEPGQIYEFIILSGTSWYDQDGEVLRFETPP